MAKVREPSFLKDSQGIGSESVIKRAPPNDLIGQMSESSIKGAESLQQVNDTNFKGVWDSNHEGSQ
jgi:hypothetical protein